MKGRRTEGTVQLAFMVDEDGRPKDPVVLSADPPGGLDRYAVMTVKRWRYKPETVGGDPVVSGPVSVVVDFADARFRETHRSLVMSRRSWHRIDRRFEDPSPFEDWEDDDF
jgi:TonB family protein